MGGIRRPRPGDNDADAPRSAYWFMHLFELFSLGGFKGSLGISHSAETALLLRPYCCLQYHRRGLAGWGRKVPVLILQAALCTARHLPVRSRPAAWVRSCHML